MSISRLAGLLHCRTRLVSPRDPLLNFLCGWCLLIGEYISTSTLIISDTPVSAMHSEEKGLGDETTQEYCLELDT